MESRTDNNNRNSKPKSNEVETEQQREKDKIIVKYANSKSSCVLIISESIICKFYLFLTQLKSKTHSTKKEKQPTLKRNENDI